MEYAAGTESTSGLRAIDWSAQDGCLESAQAEIERRKKVSVALVLMLEGKRIEGRGFLGPLSESGITVGQLSRRDERR